MYKLRLVLIWIGIFSFWSCATQPLGNGLTVNGEPIYLHLSPLHQKDVLDYRENNFFDPEDERSKIDFLIDRIRTSPCTFIRNGKEIDGKDTRDFTLWKMRRPRWRGKVHTAQDFVDIILKGSIMSGKPYAIALPDGSKHNLQPVVAHELRALEELFFEQPLGEQ